MRFTLHYPLMHLVFTFQKGRVGMRFAPFLDSGEDLFALPSPGFIVHCFFSPVPSFDATIFPAFLFPVSPLCTKMSHTQ
jgi:hypothetical protein